MTKIFNPNYSCLHVLFEAKLDLDAAILWPQAGEHTSFVQIQFLITVPDHVHKLLIYPD